jgi:hypothetical protein
MHVQVRPTRSNSDNPKEIETFVTFTSANEPDNAFDRLKRMKILLFILSFVSLSLFPPSGPSAESTTVNFSGPTLTAGRTALLDQAKETPAPATLQLASAGIDRSLGLSRGATDGRVNNSDTRGADGAGQNGDAIPSVPTGLAALLLMICILIGRRNKQELV